MKPRAIRRAWEWSVILVVVLSAWCAVLAFGQTIIAVDINRASFAWDWSKGAGGDVSKFNIKCGPTTGSYTLPVFVVTVTGAPATYTGNVPVKSVVTAPGRYFCVVTAANAFGESAASNELPFDAGVGPAGASNLRLTVQ